MEIKGSKIVIWCGDAPNQKALANKIAEKFGLTGIVVDNHRTVKKRKDFKALAVIIWDRLRFRKIYLSWKQLMKKYTTLYADWPANVPLLNVNTINDSQTEIFTRSMQPDLIIVSGTGLIKEPLINLPTSIGIMNLHTGLSPYVKGGPNCTNWCIANNEWHLTGNTIMWLNAGIDSGNIITTETVDIRSASSLTQAHYLVMEHAHNLYGRAIQYVLSQKAPYNSIPQQSIAKGTLYLTKMWNSEKRKALLNNWKKRSSASLQIPVKTVPLP